jgi:hypothetical protein
MSRKDFTSIKNTAARLITKFGQSCVVRRYTNIVPVAAEPWTISGSSFTQTTVDAVLLDFRPDQVEGYAYERGDKLIYIAGKVLSQFGLQDHDFIVYPSQLPWSLLNVTEVDPTNSDIILFQGHVRQWPRRLS